MGLFDFKIGNKNIDKSLTLRENINNTILENITNSQFATKTSANVKQEIIIDCSPIYNNLAVLYSKNNWGMPPSPEEVAKSCTAKNIEQIADITLNVTSQNIQTFGSEIETNIKKNFDQMENSIKDKNWVEASAFNKNINESQNIRRIIDNVKKSNIKNIIVETLTDANVNQNLTINMGMAENIKQKTKIALIISAISDSIVKDIDKTFLDNKISQLEKKEEKDQVSSTVGGVFGNLFSTVKTGIGMAGIIVLGVIALVGLIAVFAPQVFCFIPGINVAMGATCSKADLNKNAIQDYRNRPQYPNYPPQAYPLQAYPLQSYPPQAYQPQSYPPQGYPQSGIIVPVNPQQPMNLQQEFSE